MNYRSIISILETISFLRSVQIKYQLWFRFRKVWRKFSGYEYPINIECKTQTLIFNKWINKNESYNNLDFSFLNKKKKFKSNNIEWEYNELGKLWTYNLNYMDYLNQEEINVEIALELIDSFINSLRINKTAIDPYPIALRGINWIKFLTKHSISDKRYSSSLYAQYKILLDNLEFHLMGNHLLEDGFSLLFAAFYFNDRIFYNKAVKIITIELNEQILSDGGHFERSPMYHKIILDRLLDSINLVKNNRLFNDQTMILELMIQKSKLMIYWLHNMSFTNQDTPLLNDSAPNIAPQSIELLEYFNRLGLKGISGKYRLSSSGYRKFSTNKYECIINIGNICPKYQPGHSHADTFNFVLNINGYPLIIDYGTSTYDCTRQRIYERGTSTHNTVTINNHNSSDVWSSFRIGRRANVKIISETNSNITARHNGYHRIFKTIHERNWIFKENTITITDKLIGKTTIGTAHFWFDSQFKPEISKNTVIFKDVKIIFENSISIKIIATKIATGFNNFTDTHKIEVIFDRSLITDIKISK